jgi:hypothetical protein
VLGWTTLLRSHNLDEAGRKRAVETIERNARSQTQLVEDLLGVWRAISGSHIDAPGRAAEIYRGRGSSAADAQARHAGDAENRRIKPCLWRSTRLRQIVGTIIECNQIFPRRLHSLRRRVEANALK